jgi:5,5'-dehydrodivanillate O-demethylase
MQGVGSMNKRLQRWNHDWSKVGPGDLAGRYLRLFWHAVYRSAALKTGQAKPIKIMGDQFTLYRGGSGAANVVDFRCAHRGMQLSAGWVEKDGIRCRYHGWKYGRDGKCQERPGELERDRPTNIGISAYPTKEYRGLIFTYLGGDSAPEFPTLPEFDNDGVFEATEYSRNCSFANFLDNQLDEVHITFTHPVAFRAIPEVPRIEVETTDFAVTSYTTRPNRDVRVTEFLMPNITRLKLPGLYEGIGPADSVVWRTVTKCLIN